MNQEPTYKLFPRPSEENIKGGWKYSFEFIEYVSELTEELPAGWGSSMEEVEQVLLAAELILEERREADTVGDDA